MSICSSLSLSCSHSQCVCECGRQSWLGGRTAVSGRLWLKQRTVVVVVTVVIVAVLNFIGCGRDSALGGQSGAELLSHSTVKREQAASL